jgi:hypothetical protein
MVQFLNGMPTNIVKVGESLNAHVLPKFQERPFQGFSQSGFLCDDTPEVFVTLLQIMGVHGKNRETHVQFCE